MPNIDLTSLDIRVNGSNAETNYTQNDCFKLDIAKQGLTDASGSHTVAKLPAGSVITGARLVVLEAFAGTGASVQVKAGATVLGEAKSVSALTKGASIALAASTAYDPDNEVEIKFEETAAKALTSGVALLFIDYIPVKQFVTAG